MGNYQNKGDSLKKNIYSDKFLGAIKYYANAIDPVTKKTVKVYSYDEIFVHKEDQYFRNKQELFEFQGLLLELVSITRQQRSANEVPMCLQTIYHIESKRYLQLCADINFKSQIYKQHLSYTLKEHLQAIQIKINENQGIQVHKINNGLSRPQLLYILKQLAEVGAYLDRNHLVWENLDLTSIYIDAGYEIRVPVAYIGRRETIHSLHNRHAEKNKTDLYFASGNNSSLLFAPEQLNKNNYKYDGTNISKVFTLGLILLQCISLLDSFVNYYFSAPAEKPAHRPLQAYRINFDKINNDLKSLKHEKLAGILSRMLQVDPRKRISFSKLLQIIRTINSLQFESCLIIQ